MERDPPERKQLGRGLAALMGNVERGLVGDPTDDRLMRTVPPSSLVANPKQPRRSFPDEQLQELAASIRLKGILQPLVVRQIGASEKFEIVAGERRWRAAQLAGLSAVPVIVRDYSDEEVLEIAIIENVQRADLNPVEEALAYRDLIDRFGHTQEQIAQSLSKSRSHIANAVRLLGLPEPVLDMLRGGQLSAGHARALVVDADPAEAAGQVVSKGLTVRDTESLVKRRNSAAAGPGEGRTTTTDAFALREWENAFAERVKRPVKITRGSGHGPLSVTVQCLNEADLKAFLALLSPGHSDQ